MTVKIAKPIQGGTINSIPSKSQAHRLLICAALADAETLIACPQRSEDIDATVRCLEALGASIHYNEGEFHVIPIESLRTQPKYDMHCVLDCGESGSTLRFLLPVCGALNADGAFIMGGRLPDRPLGALYDEMVRHGCTLSRQGKSLNCQGQLLSGTYTLPGEFSSQYISGLLFALPLLERGSSINVTGVLESRPYVDMTLDALRIFGISVAEEREGAFTIQSRQTFHSPKTVTVEGDWSNAAFWLSAGAIGKTVTCTGLNLKSRQGDLAIVELLKRFGANITVDNDTVTVSPAPLRGIDIDARNTPDLVPVLSAVASVAEGKTVIRNAQRLRIKESDRLRTITTSLSDLGANITETNDGLIIIGKGTLIGGETQSFGDHRIAMTAAVISSVCTGQVMIKDAEAVNKSYPCFFNDFNTLLGGYAQIISKEI